jgi:DNA (cytosine-5)-methyltransferase 1
MAAAPGETLPLSPDPVYCFNGPHFLGVDIDGKHFSSTSTRPGAPRRALTTWDAISDLPPVLSGASALAMPYSCVAGSHLARLYRDTSSQLRDHIVKAVSPLVQARLDCLPVVPGTDWRDLPNLPLTLGSGDMVHRLHYPYRKADGTRGVCSCCISSVCEAGDKQSNTLIPWSLPHTADRHAHWGFCYSRVPWDGFFKTTITDPEPLGKQGQVVHPDQARLLSVRECARSQGFKDSFVFEGTVRDKHRQIGNAVPPPLAFALGLQVRKAIINNVW